MADPFWILAMAVNVYLTLFRRYTTDDLKRLEWLYFLLCYGVPLVIAIVLASISSPGRGKIYGRAIVRLKYIFLFGGGVVFFSMADDFCEAVLLGQAGMGHCPCHRILCACLVRCTGNAVHLLDCWEENSGKPQATKKGGLRGSKSPV